MLRPIATALWSVLCVLALRRRAADADATELEAQDYRTQTSRMGVRFTEHVRDAFRARWLKVRHDDE